MLIFLTRNECVSKGKINFAMYSKQLCIKVNIIIEYNSSKITEVVSRDRGYFGPKSKGYDSTIKREIREKPMGIKDILRNKGISSKRVPCERVYEATEQILQVGKVLITII